MATLEDFVKKLESARQATQDFKGALGDAAVEITNSAVATVKFNSALEVLKRANLPQIAADFRTALLALYQTTALSAQQVQSFAKDIERLSQASRYYSSTAVVEVIRGLNQYVSSLSGASEATRKLAITLGQTFPQGAERIAAAFARVAREIPMFGVALEQDIFSPVLAAELAFRGFEQEAFNYLQVMERIGGAGEKISGLSGAWKEFTASAATAFAKIGENVTVFQTILGILKGMMDVVTQIAPVLARLVPIFVALGVAKGIQAWRKSKEEEREGERVRKLREAIGGGEELASRVSQIQVSQMTVATMIVRNITGAGAGVRAAEVAIEGGEVAIEPGVTRAARGGRAGLLGRLFGAIRRIRPGPGAISLLASLGFGAAEQALGPSTTAGRVAGGLGTVASIAGTGALIGSMFGPVGTAVGGLIGGLVGAGIAIKDFIKGQKEAEEQAKKLREQWEEIKISVTESVESGRQYARALAEGGGFRRLAPLAREVIERRIEQLPAAAARGPEASAQAMREILTLSLQYMQVLQQQSHFLNAQLDQQRGIVSRLETQESSGAAYTEVWKQIVQLTKDQLLVTEQEIQLLSKLAEVTKIIGPDLAKSLDEQIQKVEDLRTEIEKSNSSDEKRKELQEKIVGEMEKLRKLQQEYASAESTQLKLAEARARQEHLRAALAEADFSKISQAARADLNIREHQIRALEAQKNIVRDLYLPSTALIELTMKQFDLATQQLQIKQQELEQTRRLVAERRAELEATGQLGDHLGKIARLEAEVTEMQAKRASLLAQTRRAWMEQMTAMTIGLPTGTFVLPTQLGRMAERGPAWFPFAVEERRAGIGTFQQMFMRMALGGTLGAAAGPRLPVFGEPGRSPVEGQMQKMVQEQQKTNEELSGIREELRKANNDPTRGK